MATLYTGDAAGGVTVVIHTVRLDRTLTIAILPKVSKSSLE
jgi:hypothetical protein